MTIRIKINWILIHKKVFHDKRKTTHLVVVDGRPRSRVRRGYVPRTDEEEVILRTGCREIQQRKEHLARPISI
jgi:hypothetical protein